MGIFKCCVGGCISTSETHRVFIFPSNDRLRSVWMSFLVPTNPLLLGLSKVQLRKRRVCSKHFDTAQFNELGQRISFSYPTLFSDIEIANDQPLSSEEWNVLSEHNYSRKESDSDIPQTYISVNKAVDVSTRSPQPSCSFTINEKAELIDHNYYQHPSLNREPHYEAGSAAITFEQCPSSEASTSKLTYDIPSTTVEKKVDVSTRSPQPSCSFTRNEKSEFSHNYYQHPSLNREPHYEAGSAAITFEQCPSSEASTSKLTYDIPSTTVEKKGSRKSKIITKTSVIKNIINIAHNSATDCVQRLREAYKVLDSSRIIQSYDALPRHAKTLVMMQFKQVKKRKTGHRFSFEEKMLALSIMKQSPKGYKFLEKILMLPSKRTLNRLSYNVSFEPGVNPHILMHIEQVIKNWDTKNKLCSIVYDEVAITPHLNYNEKKDEIIGFVDVAGQRKFAYCDHALVFMVRGICASWRQCIAYYFVQGTVSAPELKKILKDIVSAVAKTGLIPLALVSDQGSTFRTAVNHLREDTKRSRTVEGLTDDGTVIVAGHKLNIFFDPPHLLKGLRNNFLNKDIIWDGRTATWQDILYVYDVDNKLGHNRTMPKITSHHVELKKIKKMKVSVAAQVLSARTAAMLKYTNFICKTPTQSMATTAEVVEFIDTLFDSVNGYPGGAKKGKLRRAVKPNSPHLAFWADAIKKIKNLKFRDSKSKIAVLRGSRLIRVPCLDGWITSLESFVRISKLLFERYNVDFYYPRYINQDPLENFFGRLRALNYRNINPDPNTFIYSFKTLMITNVLGPHSKFSNCEEDLGETVVDLKKIFAQRNDENKENVSPNTSMHVPSSSQMQPIDLAGQVIMEKIRVHCSAYVAGYICRRITKKIKCKSCTKTITTENIEKIHDFIQFREYKFLKNNNLSYPSQKFLRMYRDAAQFIHNFLNKYCAHKNLGKSIKKILIKKLPLHVIGCKLHSNAVKELFLKTVMRVHIHNWCNIINKIFKGALEEKYVMKMGEPQKLALKKYKALRLRNKIKK